MRHLDPGHHLQTPTGRRITDGRGNPADERVPEATVRHALDPLEPPGVDEGFAEVVEVAGDAA